VGVVGQLGAAAARNAAEQAKAKQDAKQPLAARGRLLNL
jgi:hypothetical protein